jgi:hypothetical protein
MSFLPDDEQKATLRNATTVPSRAGEFSKEETELERRVMIETPMEEARE